MDLDDQSVSQSYVDLIPRAEKVEILKAGHMAFTEAPGEFGDTISRFIQEQG